MHKKKTFLVLFLLAAAVTIFQSCEKDDDSSPTPDTTKPEGTYSFLEIQDREWKMWTNGSEVNTTGLNIADYIPSEKMNQLNGEAMESEDVIFSQDSIFFPDGDDLVGYPYYISNDSIYLDVTYDFGAEPITITQFLGIKTASGFYIPEWFFRYVEHDESGNTTLSSSDIGYLTVDELNEEYDLFESIADLQQGDTLIILNQKVIFQ